MSMESKIREKIEEQKKIIRECEIVIDIMEEILGEGEEIKTSETPEVKHTCCGSKQKRHKKNCTNSAKATKSVKCTDGVACDWEGDIEFEQDENELSCPDCGGDIELK